jgi:hypothetical protein
VAELLLAMLLLTPRKVKLQNHRLAFVHQGKGFTFADADSPAMRLPEGTELLGYFDATRPHILHVTDLQGRYVGPVSSRTRIDIRDQEAIGAEQAEVSRLIHACVTGPLRERHAAEDRQLADDNAHNVRLQIEAGIAEPVRVSPVKHLPAAHSTPVGELRGTASTGDKAATGPKPERQGLSAKLAQTPAHVACKPHAGHLALAQGIAAEVGTADAGKTRAEALQQADELDSTSLL